MPSSSSNFTLVVPRPSSGLDPTHSLVVETPKPREIPEGHVLIRVDRFGFSANNITYQALGEAPNFRYFEFHYVPTTGVVSPKRYGAIPVWGFGYVIASKSAIKVGERVYGYFAPTRYLTVAVDPQSITSYSFSIPRPHLPADRRPYNQVTRCAGDPLYNPDPIKEDLSMLYRPLFWTSYWCEDWLFHGFEQKYHGAKHFLISSASAKTAFALAYCYRRRIATHSELSGTKIIGLTSKKNLEFTRRLGLYDTVLEYGSFTESLEMDVSRGDGNWVFTDVAGNDDLNRRILKHFVAFNARDKLIAIMLGVTNLQPNAVSEASSIELMSPPKAGDTSNLPPSTTVAAQDEKLKLETFFTVEWLAQRRSKKGKHYLTVPQIAEMQGEAWGALMQDGKDWVRLERLYGPDNVREEYERIGREGLGPEIGQIWSLWEKKQETMLEGQKVTANL
ncbi:hypothetical protein BXZ70DRAFT_5525 [Cristinia sonorae]|uniref:DUF2855 domain-containing protein n=1 Tax=Cristinia sonorae TaxID=1940300 RepID=A0A8K0UZ10_9AGAR|nr:hypothetical protein BXZ70DRAFT_5525 [Cristinia sonorae]